VDEVMETYIVTAIVLVAAGAVIGILAVVSLGIHRDDRRGGFPADTNDRIARGARRLVGVSARGPGVAGDTSRRRQDTVAA
jgi:hypothetical protein